MPNPLFSADRAAAVFIKFPRSIKNIQISDCSLREILPKTDRTLGGLKRGVALLDLVL